MSNLDKSIGVFPNTGEGSGVLPEIQFVGSGNQPISLYVKDNNDLSVSSSGTSDILVIHQSGINIKQANFTESLSANAVYVNGVQVSVSGHSHVISDVGSLQSVLDNKIDNDDSIEGGFF